MSCPVLRIDPQSPDPEAIARAAELLRGGGLVAFPTETVYGIGANALDAAAVGRIFAAKGRPPTNPVIVHVPDVALARTLAAEWSASAERLATQFWPGPLTLVVPRRPIVPDVVTAGGPTVALRVPAHPVALALLRASGLPVAAPSANRSTELSPTCAEHVLRGMADRIDLLLDAGPAPGGLESTVVDMTTQPPRILRPGLVARTELAAVVGLVTTGAEAADGEAPRSPGMMIKHYAPRTALELVAGDGRARIQELLSAGYRVGWIRFGGHAPPHEAIGIIAMPTNATEFSARLYAALHDLDALGVDRIVCELPPAGDEWAAVHDRLRRAAASS